MEELDFDSQTTWVNDSKYTAKFKLLTEKMTGKKNSGVAFREIVLKPGEKKTLPAEYDRAIRQVSAEGQIIGGLCPWLKKEGEDELDLHPCLDFESVERLLKLESLAAKIAKDKSLVEAVEQMDLEEKTKPSKKK